MKIHEILQRDPTKEPILNKGQARISSDLNDKLLEEELKAELRSFVCEGEYAAAIEKILSSYLTDITKSAQRAAWVSGFFGSGKSHLLKMICHLWQDTPFKDGSTARGLVPALPESIRDLLKELDTLGRREGGLFAAAGTMPAGNTGMVRQTVLAIVLRAAGLPEQFHLAQLCLFLTKKGLLEKVRKDVEAAGCKWSEELDDVFVSPVLHKALLRNGAPFGMTETEVQASLQAQFGLRKVDITAHEFKQMMTQVLQLKGARDKLPCTILILDEAQQYIGDSEERSTLFTDTSEVVSKELDSRVMLVAAGQSALTSVKYLNKLMDRYTIRVQLSENDVEAVTRKVLLQKKPAAEGAVTKLLEKHEGEIARHLQGSKLATVPEDKGVRVLDYPLLPVRRRFWEQCFRQLDAAGTKSQLRSQLRIIFDAELKIANRELGAVIPGDELFDALAPDLVATGAMLKEINDRIIAIGKSGTQEALLARRAAALVFLIGRLSREAAADTGVRATKEHVSDLLIDDLAGENGKFRGKVEAILEKLAADGVLMKIGDEFRLQTKESTQWEQDFQTRRTAIAGDIGRIQVEQDNLLASGITDLLDEITPLNQGEANVARHIASYRDEKPPAVNGREVPIWIRDGWSDSESELKAQAVKAGTDSPIVFVFIPKNAAEALRQAIAEVEAAKSTLDARGHPTSAEGIEAKKSMDSRLEKATLDRDEIIRTLVDGAKAFIGGGSEVMKSTLKEKLASACDTSLKRLYPRFSDADSEKWDQVLKRVREGQPSPFEPVFAGSTEQHPVCQQVLSIIGSGSDGSDVRKKLTGEPFGWPQDAIDAALMALHRSQYLSASLNETPVPPGSLDQAKVAKARFRKEKKPPNTSDLIKLAGLFRLADVKCTPAEVAAKGSEFVAAAKALAGSAGGPPPLPAAPPAGPVEALSGLISNELLAKILEDFDNIESSLKTWKSARDLAAKRIPVWQAVERLTKHANGVAAATEILKQVDAIRTDRLLLSPSDSVVTVRAELAKVLRTVTADAYGALANAHADAMMRLGEDDAWQKLTEDQRSGLLAQVGLSTPVSPGIAAEEALLAALDQRSLAAARADADACAARAARAIEAAHRLLEPQIRGVKLEPATLRTPDDVSAWVAKQEKVLLEQLKAGPILVS